MSMMQSFIQAVLGDTAAEALRKAADRSEALGTVLGPRVIVGWLGFASQWSYQGDIPGVEGSTLQFKKNQETDLFDGCLSVGVDEFDFQNASLTQLAATLTVALGANQPVSKALRDTDLAFLGKNVDLLVKSRVLQLLKAAKKPQDEYDTVPCPRSTCQPGYGAGECPQCNGSGYVKVGRPQGKTFSGEIKKAARPASTTQASGTQAAPRAQLEPTAPAQQEKAPANQRPRLPSQTTLRITKAQAETRCSVCDAASFNRRGEFNGCWCLRGLAKHASAVAVDGGYDVTFQPEWSKSNIRVLLDILGGPEATE